MHESAAPWRALEDQPTAGAATGAAMATQSPAGQGQPPGLWLAVAGLVAALCLAAATWLVMSGGTGTITVVDDSAALFAGEVVPTGPASLASGAPAVAENRAAIVVDVQGAVLRPGIVRLPAGSRVGDAIAAAGGFGPRVAADHVGHVLNLAAVLADGDKVVVPSRDDPASAAGAGGGGGVAGPDAQPGSAGVPLDLNTATAAELDSLPGVGPVTAAKIIAARDERPFASVDDLRSREVVGPATFEKIRDLVIVR